MDSAVDDLQLSRVTVVGVIAAASGSLAVSAPLVGPTRAPDGVEQLVSVAAWWVAAVLLAWLVLSLTAWAAAARRPRMAGSRLLRIMTVPGSRRLAEGLLTVGLLASCSPSPPQVAVPQIEVLGPVEPGPPTTATTAPLIDSDDLPSASTALASVGSLADAAAMVDRAAPPGHDSPGGSSLGPIVVPQTASTEPAPEAATSHVVAAGENFWTIAERQLLTHLGRVASDGEVTPYWVSLVRANAGHIRSGDPDLIYPGERIQLPSIP